MREQQASSAEMELMQQRILVEQRKEGELVQMDGSDGCRFFLIVGMGK